MNKFRVKMASFAYFWSFLATLKIFGQYLRKTFENAENLISEGSAELSIAAVYLPIT